MCFIFSNIRHHLFQMSTKNLEKFNKAEMSNAAKEDDASRSAMYKNQKLEKLPEETVQFNKVKYQLFFIERSKRIAFCFKGDLYIKIEFGGIMESFCVIKIFSYI